jgi:formylglycine-generating enzyme required for sulfatase activity
MSGGSNIRSQVMYEYLAGNVWEWCLDYWHENYNGTPNGSSAWLSGGDSNIRVTRDVSTTATVSI